MCLFFMKKKPTSYQKHNKTYPNIRYAHLSKEDVRNIIEDELRKVQNPVTHPRMTDAEIADLIRRARLHR